MTPYHVLRFTGEGGDQLPPKYELVGRDISARDADHAIRIYAERAGENGAGLYAAVPSRSWKPKQVKAETVTTLTLSEVA